MERVMARDWGLNFDFNALTVRETTDAVVLGSQYGGDVLAYLLPLGQRVDPQEVTKVPGEHELRHALLFEHAAPLRGDRQPTLRIQR